MAEAAARRYAQAFFELARSGKRVDAAGTDLADAVEVLSNREVLDALANPRLDIAARVTLALDLIDGLDGSTRNLVRLLIEHGRIRALPDVLDQYRRLADEASGVLRADVFSAVALTGKQQAAVTSALRERLGADVQVTFREDPAVVGGLVIRAGDRVIDTSIRTQLQQLQASLR